MKRFLDVVLSLMLLIFFIPVYISIFIILKLTSKGSTIYFSERVGRNGNLFKMPKFRTMSLNTPTVPTSLMTDANLYINEFGNFLRKSSLDETPQFFSVIKGDMSLVGPRPVISSETQLLTLRANYGVDKLLPGITGWAQINGRDEISIDKKVQLDIEYLERQSTLFDIKILFKTFIQSALKRNISH